MNLLISWLHVTILLLRQPLLIHVVLVKAHSDAPRVNLHQLGERVQQAPGDGHGPAPCMVEFLKAFKRYTMNI